ncbi:hypothetical protein X975_01887, partial [Stegodyphus mimosarum]
MNQLRVFISHASALVSIRHHTTQKSSRLKSEREAAEQKMEDEKYEKLIVQLIRRYLHSNGLKDSAVASASSHRCCWNKMREKRNMKPTSENIITS